MGMVSCHSSGAYNFSVDSGPLLETIRSGAAAMHAKNTVGLAGGT